MPLSLPLQQFKDFLDGVTLEFYGDVYEKMYARLVRLYFPDYEAFWRVFVVPMTNRVYGGDPTHDDWIRPREDVSAEVKRITSAHYTYFTKAVYAYRHLSHFTPECLRDYHASSFEDFYTHLGSVCDVTESCLSDLILLVTNRPDDPSRVPLEKLTAELKEWYERMGDKLYDYYGRHRKSIHFPNQFEKTVLEEYFQGRHQWKQYRKVSGLIRSYRNYIVHNIHMGKRFHYTWGSSGGIYFQDRQDPRECPEDRFPSVPKKERIGKYPSWDDTADHEVDTADFVDMKRQMDEDFALLLDAVNELWKLAIPEWSAAFFGRDPNLARHFQVEWIDDTSEETSEGTGEVEGEARSLDRLPEEPGEATGTG